MRLFIRAVVVARSSLTWVIQYSGPSLTGFTIFSANLEEFDLYGYVTYLLKKMTWIRGLSANSVDYGQFLPWNLTPKLRKGLVIPVISIK